MEFIGKMKRFIRRALRRPRPLSELYGVAFKYHITGDRKYGRLYLCSAASKARRLGELTNEEWVRLSHSIIEECDGLPTFAEFLGKRKYGRAIVFDVDVISREWLLIQEKYREQELKGG